MVRTKIRLHRGHGGAAGGRGCRSGTAARRGAPRRRGRPLRAHNIRNDPNMMPDTRLPAVLGDDPPDAAAVRQGLEHPHHVVDVPQVRVGGQDLDVPVVAHEPAGRGGAGSGRWRGWREGAAVDPPRAAAGGRGSAISCGTSADIVRGRSPRKEGSRSDRRVSSSHRARGRRAAAAAPPEPRRGRAPHLALELLKLWNWKQNSSTMSQSQPLGSCMLMGASRMMLKSWQ